MSDDDMKHKVSKAAMDWASREIDKGVLEAPLAKNSDGSFKTLRQLLDEAKTGGKNDRG